MADILNLGPRERDVVRRLAARYIWWKTPDEALQDARRVAAQVMNIGDYDDVQGLVAAVGDDFLRQVLRTAEAGEFDARSWAYWHYRLALAEPGAVPPLPRRRVA
jgi:hypothetical protein